MAEAGAAGIFGGRLAKTADQGALKRAEEMAAAGGERQAIWDQTGWFQGADKKWRFEIPDDLAHLETPRHAPPGYESLQHLDLQDAYPEMWGRTQQSIKPDPVRSGSYHREHDTIIARGPTEESRRGVALHELQHAVQNAEGFTPGANPIQFTRDGYADDILNQWTRGTSPSLGEVVPGAFERWQWDQYKRTAGEVEARNVQARRNMTPEQRRETPPWETQDVPDGRQILGDTTVPSPPSLSVAELPGGMSGAKPVSAHDILAELEAAIGGPAPGASRAGAGKLDPAAPVWDLYHGAGPGADFRRFDPNAGSNPAEHGAIFFAPDPTTASHYAGMPQPGTEAGSRVFRTTVEPGKTAVFDLGHLAETDPAFNARARQLVVDESGPVWGTMHDRYLDGFRDSRARHRDIAEEARAMGFDAGDPTGISFGYGHIGAAVERAKAQGLDTAILRGLAEHGGQDQVIALTPGRVRSYYAPDQLLYAGAPVGLASAAMLGPGDAQAASPLNPAPNPGPTMASSPFGFGLPLVPGANPEGTVRLLQRGGISPAQGLGLVEMAPQAEQAVQAQPPAAVEPRPVAPFGFAPQVPAGPTGPGLGAGGFGALPAPQGGAAPVLPPDVPRRPASLPAVPAPAATPLPPARPAEFGGGASREPLDIRPGAQPAPAAPAAASGPSAWDRFATGIGDNADLFLSLGQGLLSKPGFGQGIAAGTALYQQSRATKAATDLARAKQAVEMQKLARETQGITANAGIIKQAYPGITDEQATALAANTANVTEALKIRRDPSHGTGAPTGYRLRADGQGYEAVPGGPEDAATKEQMAAAAARGTAAGKPDETYAPLSEEDRVARGLPPGAYQVDSKNKVSPVNPTGTTINMGAEKAQDATVGKGYGDYQLDLANKGRNATSTLNTLALMEQALRTPGFYSGVGGEGVKRANQFLTALGVRDAKATSAAEVFDALSNKVVLDGLGGSLGGSLGPGISNTDRDYISRTAPTLVQSEQGNRDLIGIARSLAQRQQAVAKLAREYAGSHGGRLDAGFDQALEDFAAQNPIFPQAREGIRASAPAEPPQGAPGGARQAPDGRWYVQDPNRPGKYLQVN
ncbi:LPD23 domain-containing protein [uncultured Methylobacterium sp.]|uniref:LPD23 domain-containing protein n=1 Tax=uncultured Methylobacterium sp. TaxID=157278 RepID=UPI00263A3C09|nr:LPD23 domain-containing protein [uncultured Methylobacterium sp.]